MAPAALLPGVRAALAEMGALPEGPALVGVSGGRDSVALLHALHALEWKHLVVCHLDHALRPESADDAEFVASLAHDYGCEAEIVREDVGSHARASRQSLEAAARDRRYAFFERVAKERGASVLFLGHHADDQVETFLFRLLRGAGTAGLRAMSARSVRMIDVQPLQVIRPLIGIWREEIDAYVAAHRLTFREDASNADLRHSRNRLRHETLRSLEETFGRDVRMAVWRAATVLDAEDRYIASLPEVTKPLSAELSVAELHGYPVAIQRRILLRWLREQGIADVGFTDVENVRALLKGGHPAKVNLSGACHARRRAGKLFIERPSR